MSVTALAQVGIKGRR